MRPPDQKAGEESGEGEGVHLRGGRHEALGSSQSLCPVKTETNEQVNKQKPREGCLIDPAVGEGETLGGRRLSDMSWGHQK